MFPTMAGAQAIILPIHYLPSIQYFTKLLLYERVLIEQHEHYQKGSYRNRCHLAGPNKMEVLSIPLIGGKHQQQAIRQVRISRDTPWQKQHWRTIRTAYSNSPFFDFYAEALEPLLRSPAPFLFDFNRDLLLLLLTLTGLSPQIEWTEQYLAAYPPEIPDFRHRISPKPGKTREDPFFRAVPYQQVFQDRHGFMPNLSILDLLFCTGPQSIQILQQCLIRPE